MWDFIKYLLRLFFEAVMGGIGWHIAKQCYVKLIADPDSGFHYKKLLQKMSALYFGIRLMVIISIYSLFKTLGLSKPLNKDETKTMIIIVAVLLMVISAVIIQSNNKKKSLS